MKYSSKTATVLIYTIILVNISLLMAIVILNNGSLLSSSKTTENIATKLVNNITDTTSINFKLHKTLNSNGGGFVDNVGCPNNVTMSGATGIVTNLVLTGGVLYCEGTYLTSNDFKIYLNSEITDVSLVEYNSEFKNVSSGSLTTTAFSDGAVLDLISTGSYMRQDNFDDNFNSDNYSVNSTGTTYYNDGYSDDDADVRMTIYGYVSPDSGYVEMLWSNEKTNSYIINNSNNNDSINTRASTSSGYLYLDADKSFDLKIVEFNRAIYSSIGELRSQTTTDYTSSSGALGYIQTDGTLSGSTASGYEFDFPSSDYAVFLNNTGSGVLFYTLRGEALSGSGLYINPIVDDEVEIMRTLGNNIIINEQGRYVGKQSEIVSPK